MHVNRLLGDIKDDHVPDDLYLHPHLADPLEWRPSILINMVATVDGKTLAGPPGSTAMGLGSSTDQLLMRRLQSASDGAIIGAGTLRAGNVVYEPRMWRATITSSGDVPLENRFFTDVPDRAIVFAPESISPRVVEKLQSRAKVILAGETTVDLRQVVEILRHEFNVRHLVVEGGATLNYSFFEAGLVDELFLTLAPKLKGGASRPTVVDGPGFPGFDCLNLDLVSVYRDGNELYLRYRVGERG